MRAQTLQPDQWIVVDDGSEPCIGDHLVEKVAAQHKGFVYVRRTPGPIAAGVKSITYPENLLEAVKHVHSDLFAVVEDDDWRGPRYIEALYGALVENVHAALSLFWQYPTYHLPTGFYSPSVRRGYSKEGTIQIRPKTFMAKHFNMHLMGWVDRALKILQTASETAIVKSGRTGSGTKKAIDVMRHMWRGVTSEELSAVGLCSGGHLVGIKGLPGRSITGVHRVARKIAPRYKTDGEDRQALRRLVGDSDAKCLLSALV